MGGSKLVIGEALKLLSRAKVVRVQRGVTGGVFVLTDNVSDSVMATTTPLRYLSLSEIVEARQPIEFRLAILAAERGTEQDFDKLQSCVEGLSERRYQDLAVRIRFDHFFHYTIGRISRSRALALYQHQILEQLFLRMYEYFAFNEDVGTVIEMHQRTADAIRSRDVDQITVAITEHMSSLESATASLESAD